MRTLSMSISRQNRLSTAVYPSCMRFLLSFLSPVSVLTVFLFLLPGFLGGYSFIQGDQRGCLITGIREEMVDSEELVLEYANDAADRGQWDIVNRMTDGLKSFSAKHLYARSLYEMEEFRRLIEYVDGLNRVTHVRLFRSIAPYYLLSLAREEGAEGFTDVIELQKKFFPDETREGFKQVIYSLLTAGLVEQVYELIHIFPEDAYQPGEKEFIFGVTEYYSGNIEDAKNYFDSILPQQIFYDGATHYLSLIYYQLGQIHGLVESEKLSLLNDEVNYNIALVLLKTGNVDDANSVALQIENDNLRTTIELFVAWESGHYRTALTLLEKIDDFSYIDYCLSSLIVAESYYHTNRFRDAETVFKLYNTFDKADKQYANHALGYSFKGFYRYNSTAYYWIKNLEDRPSFYDSLAAYNLSRLYTFTENYYSAWYYFDYYINRYGIPENDPGFIGNYAQTLYGQGNLAKYGEILIEYKNVLPLRKVVDGLVYLGNHHHENNEPRQALYYWQQALQMEDNEDLVLQTYRLRFSMGEFEDSEDFILTLIGRYPQSSFVEDLSLDLTKFYLTQERFDTAESFIDSLLVLAAAADSLVFEAKPQYTDSLRFFKGLALKHQGQPQDALHHFFNLNRNLETTNLREPTMQNMRTLLGRVSPQTALDILEYYIEKDSEMQEEYMIMLAEVYEQQNLYAEANRIYRIINEEHAYMIDYGALENDSLFTVPYRKIDPELYYRLALNEIRQRSYSQALEYLNEIITFSAEVNEDILFLNYLAHYSKGKTEEAIKILLDLYYDYPQSPKRFEITKNLIEQFIESELEIYAWFFIKDYYPLATAAEQWQLERYRESLAERLKSDTLAVSLYIEPLLAEGLNIQSILADSLIYKQDGEWFSVYDEDRQEDAPDENEEDYDSSEIMPEH